jgi:hypothetical protein
LAAVSMSGDWNSISGLTITGSGSSKTEYSMPNHGYSDAGRTIVSIMG